MVQSIGERLERWAGAWTAAVVRRPRLVVLGAVLASAAIAPSLRSLAIRSDEEALFAEDTAYSAARDEFRRAFPAQLDPIVVVVDGAQAARVDEVTGRLAARIGEEPELFPAVLRPDGGDFFDRNGLLYLDPAELVDVLDHLVEAQPYLGTLAVDPSLRGLFELLALAADETATATATATGEDDRLELEAAFDGVRRAIEGQASGTPHPLDWGALLLGSDAGTEPPRRVLLVQPTLDFETLEPAAATLTRLRELAREVTPPSESDVRVRMTGVYALAQEEAELVSSQANAAGIAAFALVMIVLGVGLRSLRVVAALIVTLLVGLLWTAAFAALAVGHLNLISVAFAVLFIGLSVDFGIHLCVRTADRSAGAALQTAVVAAARDVGPSLMVCALTTTVGFYAFIGTDFLGVAELGLIAGTGMIIGLVANLTLLPALLVLWPAQFASPGRPVSLGPRRGARLLRGLVRVPVAYPRAVLAATAMVAAGAALLAPRAHFDWNPLRVRDPSAPSVEAFVDLLADGRAHPWNLNVLAPDRDEAQRLAARLETLPSVDEAISLDDYVPDDQDVKRAWIDDAAFLLEPDLELASLVTPPSEAEQREVIALLAAATDALGRRGGDASEANASRRLALALADLEERLEADPAAARALHELEQSLLGSLPSELDRLRRLLAPDPIRLDTLPEEIRSQWIADDGRVRVELFPAGDLGEKPVLERYVDAVRAVAPGVFGEGLVIYEIGRTVVGAFQQALSLAAVLILALLVAQLRSLRDTALAVTPMTLAALLTVAGTVVLDLPFNFANVIVIPLLLGMGVDSSIHMIHRVRSGPLPGGGLLTTSTSKAVLLSALTTLASFGTLGFSTHLGMRSLGTLLTLGIGLILVSNLVVLTAIVRLIGGPDREPADGVSAR